MLRFAKSCVSVFFLSLIAASASEQQAQLRGVLNAPELGENLPALVHENVQLQELLCRITIVHSLFMEDNNTAREEDELHCIPIIDSKESENTYAIKLPEEFIEEHYADIRTGTMLMTVSNANITSEGIETAANTEFKAMLDVPDHLRHLVETLFTTGTKTLALVRISLEDSTPTYNLTQLKSIMYDANVTLFTQYYACSFGQLKYVLSNTGFMDLKLPGKYLADFASPEALVDAVQNYLTAKGTPANTLADTVIMCLPPGTPTSWVGKAPLRHWRAMFNDFWTVSISNVMHELGHLMGLLHAGRDGNEYADIVGYMSWGLRSATFPRKCYNGEKSWDLGWYKNRHLKITLPADGAKKFNVSAFTDYNISAANEPAIVNINDDLFLMYNRKESFNIETEEKQDQITVTQRWVNRSDSLAGLSAGTNYTMANYNGTGKTLIIDVCSRTDRTGEADVMEVSIGLGVSLCGVAVPAAGPLPTSAPVKPTSAPVKLTSAPVAAPTCTIPSKCTANSQCCGGTCQKGVCKASTTTTSTCKKSGSTCSANSQCCSKTCKGSKCK